jgi:UDP-3-O-[3-hydroxymyristoyl] N-acetylglucosamine deacetylase
MIEIADSQQVQTTIARPVAMEGFTPSDGLPCACELQPAPADQGIVFTHAGQRLPATIAHFDENETRHTSTLRNGELQVQTVEHFLGAIRGCGIDNLTINLDSCGLPFQDFSAEFFVKYLTAAGVTELAARRRVARVKESFEITGADGRCLQLQPSAHDELEISCQIDFPTPLGRHTAYYHSGRTDFVKEIAWARSFICSPLGEDPDKWNRIRRLYPMLPEDPRAGGLIAYDQDGFLTPLRQADEPARHKLLDLIGDLSLLGYPLAGRLEAHRPGHRFTADCVRRLNQMIAC